jgi:hypothetical protein
MMYSSLLYRLNKMSVVPDHVLSSVHVRETKASTDFSNCVCEVDTGHLYSFICLRPVTAIRSALFCEGTKLYGVPGPLLNSTYQVHGGEGCYCCL